ncbi:MAG: hypothetical protein AB8H03_19165 [Saprospiraceae bacterium]
MENEILDLEIEEKQGSNFRKRLLLIECILVIIILISISLQRFTNFSSPRLISIIAIFSFILFYLVNPLFRFFKKESNGKISFLYFLQNLLLLPFLFGIILKFASWPYASEMIIGGLLGFTLLFIIPHLELEKVNTTRQLHIYTFLINLAFLISFLGVIFKLESWRWSFELCFIGGILSLIVFVTVIISLFSNPKKFTPIGYYIPRLLFGIYLTFHIFIQIIRNIIS